MEQKSIISDNLKKINENIARAAEKAGRKPSDITLVGVTKTIGIEMINELISCGVTELGENRVQELTEKMPAISDNVNWHLIGHLQTNKVKYVVGKVKLIHSVDSARLAAELNKAAAKKNVVADILIEINIAGEVSKHGIKSEQVEKILEEIIYFDNIKVKGLMTVAPIVENPEENKQYFIKMTELFLDMKHKFNNNIDMQFLSMGMTNDYQAAIEEGANMVRIGTGIFRK